MHHFLDILKIIMADVFLSGDNALVIGMAAAGLPAGLRKKAIFWGMALAAALRVFFAAIASYLLAIPGILFIGGLLLAVVCWRFYGELREHHDAPTEEAAQGNAKQQTLIAALVTITIADVSMSIDNVVAVAAIARENTGLLVVGLVLSIAFMAFFANIIMRLMTRFRWLPWLGLVFLVYLAFDMLHDGWPEIWHLVG